MGTVERAENFCNDDEVAQYLLHCHVTLNGQQCKLTLCKKLGLSSGLCDGQNSEDKPSSNNLRLAIIVCIIKDCMLNSRRFTLFFIVLQMSMPSWQFKSVDVYREGLHRTVGLYNKLITTKY